MLDYTEVQYINQAFATRSESVTPFLISFWQGTIELTPATDTWMDQVRLEPKITEQEGNFAETMKRAEEQFDVDPQTGMGPTIWDAWEENWTGTRQENITPQFASLGRSLPFDACICTQYTTISHFHSCRIIRI